jgi:hypothetical protein
MMRSHLVPLSEWLKAAIRSWQKTGSRWRAYIHGDAQREHPRLQDQASTLVEVLHADTTYSDGSSVLEAGCGVGS